MPSQEELRLKQLRNQFYICIREEIIQGIQWYPARGNHMDFKLNTVTGHVNWYFRNKEVNRYQGNVCVVLKQNTNTFQIQEECRVHPVHGDWVIMSYETNDVQEAVAWASRIIQSARH